jgi:hypothetical protein
MANHLFLFTFTLTIFFARASVCVCVCFCLIYLFFVYSHFSLFNAPQLFFIVVLCDIQIFISEHIFIFVVGLCEHEFPSTAYLLFFFCSLAYLFACCQKRFILFVISTNYIFTNWMIWWYEQSSCQYCHMRYYVCWEIIKKFSQCKFPFNVNYRKNKLFRFLFVCRERKQTIFSFSCRGTKKTL